MASEALNANVDWQQRWMLLVDKVEWVPTWAVREQLLVRLSQPKEPSVLAFANAHAMNSLAASHRFFDALNSADIVLRDGSGMATLLRLLGRDAGLNLNGTDLIPALIRRFDGRGIAVFGTQDPYLQRALQVMSVALAPQSSLVSAHGFLDIADYVAMAERHQPPLILLGMGMPRQEEVAAVLRSTLVFPCLIVCGGAIIDFLGGKTPRAPAWMRAAGLEWVFRLALEPRRLFHRYVLGNPLFLSRALRLASMHRV